MTVRIYRSTDVGAPALSAVAGALITVLDAILVNGYGTGLDAKTPLGWTKEFSGTSVAAYRNSATSVARSFFYIGDLNAAQSKIVGFESMTSISAGTGMWPDYPQAFTVSSGTTGLARAIFLPLVLKGAAWMAIGDENTLHFFCGATMATLQGHYIGDGESLLEGAPYNSVIIGTGKRPNPSSASLTSNGNGAQFSVISRNSVSPYSMASTWDGNNANADSSPTYAYPYGAVRDNPVAFDLMIPPSPAVSAVTYGNQVKFGCSQLMRHPTHKLAGGVNMYLKNESNTSAAAGTVQITSMNGATSSLNAPYSINAGSSAHSMTYPLEGGGLHLDRYAVSTDGVAPFYDACMLRGVWQPTCNISAMAHGDTFTGSGSLAGKTFEVMKLASGVNCCIETSNTW